MLAMFLARKHTRAAYAEIGQFFGNRQHSTVISAQKKVEEWIEKNEVVPHGMGSIGVREALRNLELTLQVG
jgi:chromosomal replication initiator protein